MASSLSTKATYDLLLLGRTGHGKSAAGNSIVGRRAFPTSSSSTSTTFAVDVAWAERDDCVVKVTDGPGIGDTRLDKGQAVEKAVENIATALTTCTRGFHAIIIVFRFGHKFGLEEQDSFELLRAMLGPDVFVKYGICVITHGDQFAGAMEEENTPDTTLVEWCLRQDSNFANWLQECGSRVVLFDNRTKEQHIKHEQVEELLRLVRILPSHGERYSSTQLDALREEHQRLIIRSRLPQMEESVQQTCSLFRESLENINFPQPGAAQRVASVKRRAHALIAEIQQRDQGTNILTPLTATVESVLLMIERFESARRQGRESELQGQISNLQEEFDRAKTAARARAEDESFTEALKTFCRGVIAPFAYISRNICCFCCNRSLKNQSTSQYALLPDIDNCVSVIRPHQRNRSRPKVQ